MSRDEGKNILVVDDDQDLCKDLAGYLTRAGHQVKVGLDGAEALLALDDGRPFDLVITGLNLPRAGGMDILRAVKGRQPATPVVILTQTGSVRHAVEAMKEGAADFLLKPVTVELMEELAQRMLRPKSPAKAGKGQRQIVTQDMRMQKLLEMARAVADSRATVLISGESGTGKELFARYLHDNSSRRGGPFVAVNCASLPDGLLESELFGHEKGAFTGAVARKPGRFELANEGTILLDEISEMAVGLQAKLLRVLQEGEIDRVGGKRPVPVDVRVVATTNRDLKEHIAKGEFREDLYYRLNVIPLRIPPLRQRPGDILPLAQHFLAQFAAENNRPALTLGPEAQRMILAHQWPGNVRELQNTMERAVLLAQGEVVGPAALLFEDQLAGFAEGLGFAEPPVEQPLPFEAEAGPIPTLRDAERSLIMRALDDTEGNRTHAAKMLGISVRTLRNKLNEYKLKHGMDATP
ncbi:two component, sigma54 specific, transcriptional regulator, Fis family [Desulfarculus baarsii DSM 2075]|uniref:Two component, sigma54 specific, transcriptional regulator, Fis family n=1 Tax=Desulfarculus baarsii (strain ATCC 33931 / DSM 2075 / LMG 7858 / VKM B-1802 / 2st14) TaxID=644282 RepID=E1QFE2_DESB2|nr:sigma-54 dependent transcriptional regulator [Desulfarculus baarsii]ADK84278.1 two component, sigma54 specific, transcriptional regulator, Fis family [Desulfarculus baarsii DSM 2075]